MNMALTEEQDRQSTVTREKLATMNNEQFMQYVSTMGVVSVTTMLLQSLDDSAKKSFFELLKAQYPELWP
jgi:hypothetical protein